MDQIHAALETFCNENRPTVRKRVSSPNPVSIAITVAPGFRGDALVLGAGYMSAVMRADRSCKDAGVSYLEGSRYGDYVPGVGRQLEHHRHAACGPEQITLQEPSSAQFELHIGEVVSPMKSAEYAGATIEKVSVRLVDRTTGEELAEDSVYLLGGSTNMNRGSCRDAQVQIISLLRSVFGGTS
jgi:hypothetical protein